MMDPPVAQGESGVPSRWTSVASEQRSTARAVRLGAPRRRLVRVELRLAFAFLGASSLPTACVYDADERCSPGQVLSSDTACVCAEGSAFTPQGCVPCAENEVPGTNGCVCADGLARPTPDAACQALPPALGAECDAASAPCTDPRYDYCQPVSGQSGYCTRAGCTSSAECEGGYACNTTASPPYCQRPPLGADQPCQTPADCAGTEATWCDTVVTSTCLVAGCSVAEQDCFGGMQCCDFALFGVPQPLCVAPGGC